ncbi:MAG TPA: phosphatidylglycerophosphatase A [Pyrinomonadaceae bacterium]|nr:phosphatidylglycerophosphatase A [Pyrinomonadaceae bacterium]HMP65122.1 phosphatidylglycerophosphatase A [Pyrinomonadaceae bacterium]
MKKEIEHRTRSGALDNVALAFSTWGVGYLPLAPGTWGSMVGVGIYLLLERLYVDFAGSAIGGSMSAVLFGAWALVGSLLVVFVLSAIGIWASSRAIALLGNEDPSEVVVDEVIGQLIVFLFVPFGLGWPMIITGFLLFRLFDLWKPYPINTMQALDGGLGICVDDIAAGLYAGAALALVHAVVLTFG